MRVPLLLFASLLPAFANGLEARFIEQNATPNLAGTSWQLLKFEGGDGKTLSSVDQTKYSVAFAADGRVSVRIDCNRGTGTWKSAGPNQLVFGPLALTRAACPAAPLTDRLTKDWSFVRSYVIKDDHLFLALMADAGTYEFVPSAAQTTKSPVSFKGPIKYDCTQAARGSETLTVTFYQTAPGMVLVERGTQARPAFQVPAADGAKYEGQDLMFWDARGEAQVNWSGAELKCRPR